MLLVREIFICKPGSASKFAKLMKETMPDLGASKATVMTDFVGQYNKVVIEYELENMAAFEKMMEDYSKNMPKETQAKMANYYENYQTGSREIYRIVEK